MRVRRKARRPTCWSSLCGIVVVMVLGCSGKGNQVDAAAMLPPAAMVPCATSLDTIAGVRGAAGLVVECQVKVPSAGNYVVEAQLYQDRRRGPVSYANERGQDISNSALGNGRPTGVTAPGAGALNVRLWFPGSEIHARAKRGDAAIDVQVSAELAAASRDSLAPPPPQWFRCSVSIPDPSKFAAQLPHQGVPPPLPRPVAK